MDDTSIRDFNRGIGCHVASTLEQTLLLPKDMVELRGLRKNEVFLNTKRYLGMVWCLLFVVVFFLKKKLITTMHIYILLICYGTDSFSLRLSKILSSLRR